jgi:hypothetical protein
MTTINRLRLFTEIISVYCENHMKHTNAFSEQRAELLNAKESEAYSWYRALKSL